MKNTNLLSDCILNILRENYTEDEINCMTRKDILDAWLVWHGIIGYTSYIISVIEELFPSSGIENNSTVVMECDFDCKVDETEEI